MLPFLHRRDFLKGSAALAGAALLNSEASSQDAPAQGNAGANNRLNVAVIGVNGRGMDHVAGFTNQKLNLNVRVTHVCDCDSAVVRRAVERVGKVQGTEPTYV